MTDEKRNYLTADDLARRARLQAAIDRKDAKRGRPLTEQEKYANLIEAMTRCDSCEGRIAMWTRFCPHCGYDLLGDET